MLLALIVCFNKLYTALISRHDREQNTLASGDAQCEEVEDWGEVSGFANGI